MSRTDQLLDLLDRWDELDPSARISPEEFCKDHADLLNDFVQLIRQRGVISALLSAETSSSIRPESMIERMQTGRYPVLQFHEQGGLGWVYLAKDRELGRTVALKCLQPGPATDPLARERFLREAEITAKLEHPGVVPIYGCDGTPKQEHPYYTMRFIRGETLRNAIVAFHASSTASDWRSLQAIRLLRAFVAICDTIAFAHSKSVIHRDLKSSNIMLGAYGETLVLDWGLARLTNDPLEDPDSAIAIPKDAERDIHVTQVGATLGTVAFMSPEQAYGNWAQVGPPSDIFSLGAILYQILTNQTPYSGEDGLANARLCRFAAPTDVKPEVPRSLAAICLKAMQPSVSDRYPSAIELKHDIELFLADEPVTARTDSVFERASRWLRKHRTVVQLSGWMGLATIVMLSAFLSIAAQQNRQLEVSAIREKQARDEAISQRDRANAELRTTLRESYAANMAQLSQAITDRQPTRHATTLTRSRPRVGTPIDVRGPEWWMNWWIAYGDARPLPKIESRCTALIDQGRKIAVYRTDGELQILEVATNQKLLSKVITGLRIQSPRDIPVSSDGSTVAFLDGSLIEVYRTTGSTYAKIFEFELENGSERGIDHVLLSNEGKVIAIVGIDGFIRAWDLTTRMPYGSIQNLGRVQSARLSSNGRFLAFLQEERPAVFELATGQRWSLEGIERGEFHGLAFGLYDTLILWSNSLAVTLGIDHAANLTELWQTKLPCPPELVESRSIRIEREVMEWIVLSEEGQLRRQPVASAPSHSRSLAEETRATILLVLGTNGAQMFYREPGGTYPWIGASYDNSEQPDRITELASPFVRDILDATSDGSHFLVRRGKAEHWIVPRCKCIREISDIHPHRGEVHRLAWTGPDEVLSLTRGTTFLSRTLPGSKEFYLPEANRLNTAAGLPASWRHTIKGSQATISDNGNVVASFGDQRFRVFAQGNSTAVYEFEMELSESLMDNGTVNLFAWNRFDDPDSKISRPNDASFEDVLQDNPPARTTPMDLPWILVFQNERSRDVTAAVDRITTRVFIIDYQNSTLVHTIEVPSASVESVAIRSDGREFAISADDLTVQAWSIGDDKSITKAWKQTLGEAAQCLSYLGNTSNIAAGNGDGDVFILGPGDCNELLIRNAHESPITAISYSESGKRLITAGTDNTVRMFDSRNGNEVFQYPLQNTPTSLAVHPHTNAIAIGDAGGHILVLPRAAPNDVWQLAKVRSEAQGQVMDEEAVLSELWSEFVGRQGRSDEELEPALLAIESIRGRLPQVATLDELQILFRQSLPPGY